MAHVLAQIDPTTHTIVKSISLAPATREDALGPWIAFAHGAIWFGDLPHNRILRTLDID